MKRLAFLCSLLAAIYFISCDDNGPGPDGSGPLFEAKVVDTAGAPVVGLRVGSINHSDYLEKQSPPPRTKPATEISFSLPSTGYVTLRILDYYGQLITSLLDSVQMEAGHVTVRWDASGVVSGFYRYRLLVWSNDSLSVDVEKWMVLELAPDPAQTIIGMTDTSGYFVTDDTLLFPCLLGAPPPIIRTDATGQVIDTVYDFYQDTVTITLSDTAEPNKFMYFERPLIVGENYFKLMWDPTQAQ